MKCQQYNSVEKNKVGDFMAEKEEYEEVKDKKMSGFQKFLLWGVIPLLFIIAVLLIVAKVANVNAFDYVKKVVSPIVATEEAPHAIDQEAYVELQAKYQQAESELEGLKEQVKKLEEEKEALTKEKEEVKKANEKEVAEDAEVGAPHRELKDLVRMYERMSAQKAADIVVKLNDAEALNILTNMKPDTASSILEKMEPEQAAKYTSMMSQ